MEGSSADDGLSVHCSLLIGYAVATVAGSVTFGTHTLLEERLTAALATTKAALVVDMAEVGFCDSSGLNVFAKVLRLARARGLALIVVGLRGRVANVFRITGLDEALHLQPDLMTAVRWLETGTGSASGTGDAS